jgi:hypothetical protein
VEPASLMLARALRDCGDGCWAAAECDQRCGEIVGDLARRLVDNAQQSAATALHRCHHALELDGTNHSYTTEEWLLVVCDAPASSSNPAAQAKRVGGWSAHRGRCLSGALMVGRD